MMKRCALVFSVLIFSFLLYGADPYAKPVGLVVIDPGHGGHDPGGIGNGLQEKDIVLDISLMLREELQKRGLDVRMTRTDDSFVELADRCSFAAGLGYGLDESAVFVSIHANSFPVETASGFEVFTNNRGKVTNVLGSGCHPYYGFRFASLTNKEISAFRWDDSRQLCESVVGSISAALPHMRNRGGKEDDLYVLNCTPMPAILVEVGFVSNAEDARSLGSAEFQRRMAAAIADGIRGYSLQIAGL